MPARVTIRPRDGVRIPMPHGYGVPHGQALPKAGLTVTTDPFINRLIQDGDAELVTDADAGSANPDAAPATDAVPPAADPVEEHSA